MYIDRIPNFEASINTRAEYKLDDFALPIPGDNSPLTGRTVARSDGFQGYFYSQPTPKQRIVLHFTAGVLTGDFQALMKEHISVAFVLSRGGTVYRLFHPWDAWSYHLGREAVGGNTTQSKSSIGIEISNLGPLKEHENKLYTSYDFDGVTKQWRYLEANVYSSLDHPEHYIVLDKPFRGYSHYASYTPQQINALIVLLRYLTATYKIPRAFLPEPKRYETTDEVTTFSGIVSHVNFRPSGKFDLGPAFPWDEVIKGVTAPVYVSTTPLGRGAPMIVESEAALDRGFVPTADNKFDPDEYGEDGPPEADSDSLRPA